MSFAILRTAKLKNFGSIGGSLSHNYRTRNTPNADPNLSNLNEHSLQTAESVRSAIEKRLPEKRRSDAVLCIEHLITASPDWRGWNTQHEAAFFEKSKKWLEKKYGAENVISTTIHRDETTPHLIAYVVPLDDTGRLNAKKWLGGKAKLSQMQTDFANEVQNFGLNRGLKNSKAEHQTIQNFYANIENQNFDELKQLERIDVFSENIENNWRTSKDQLRENVASAIYENADSQFEQMQNDFNAKIKIEKNKVEAAKTAEKKALARISHLEKQVDDAKQYVRFKQFADEADKKTVDDFISKKVADFDKYYILKDNNGIEQIQKFEKHTNDFIKTLDFSLLSKFQDCDSSFLKFLKAATVDNFEKYIETLKSKIEVIQQTLINSRAFKYERQIQEIIEIDRAHVDAAYDFLKKHNDSDFIYRKKDEFEYRATKLLESSEKLDRSNRVNSPHELQLLAEVAPAPAAVATAHQQQQKRSESDNDFSM